MKKTLLFLFCFSIRCILFGQQFSCDSVQISSIQLSTVNPTIEVVVKNSNIDIISYPGFIMFNSNGDTLAKESVNYFGIGWTYQLHELNIINPINLPLNGYLELHSLFYDTLVCTFPYTLDTSLNSVIIIVNNIKVFPNPSIDDITITVNNFNGNIQTEVFDLIGNKLQTTNETTISLRDYSKGIYLLKVAYGDRVEEVKVIKD
ncbi:MAG: T9SS type A sorting domain-containing protein [Flavobacteriales bacterium]